MSEINPQNLAPRTYGSLNGTGIGLAAGNIVSTPYGIGTDFNGTDEYIKNSIAGFRSGDSCGAISALIKRSSTGVADTIFSSCDEGTALNYGLQFYVRSTNKLTIRQRNNDAPDLISGGTSLAADRWYHVAVVSDGTSYALYLDGEPESLTVIVGGNNGDWFADTDNRDNFTIGAYEGSSVGDYFAGVIDTVMTFDAALTQLQINDLYGRMRRGMV
jgi:hypothetical protein